MGEILQTIQTKSSNLNAGDVSLIQFANTPFVAKLLFYSKIAFYMIVCLAIVYVVWKLWLQYKVKITIYSKVGGGGLETTLDRAKIVTDKDGRTKLQILKTKKGKIRLTCPIPPAQYKTKSGRSDHYNLWLDDNFQVHPIMPPNVVNNEYVTQFKIIPEERKAWSRQERRQIEQQYQNKNLLDKYLPSMIVLSAFMIAFLIFFFMSKDLAASLTSLTQQFGNVANSCLALNG